MKKLNRIAIAPLMVAVIVLVLFSTGFTAVSQPLTSQTWAVTVGADPGHTGSLSMNFEAAYGLPKALDDDAYVGDYFNITQHAKTSSGTTGRYIDVSSPKSGGYLYEDMLVVGMADIKESFSMMNLPAGSAVAVAWWRNLFTKI